VDADAMHLWLDELHGELRSWYEVHLVLRHGKASERHPLQDSSFCAHQGSGWPHQAPPYQTLQL